ncbi:DedA family protein [Dactylosporangium roseum]|uniref:DedA family protein n=1 Tax=Dactylosporangium roseum TaxID=47989 RepID=A0ABY5ZCV5_9ACTN|nr:DedA family protein [Dactylosporangium roseum]UWZ39935.1 DedA family protein [Dactylosporangium roseum]
MEWLHRYGYPALALIVLLEGVGVPTPAVTAIVVAAGLAAHGSLSLPVVAVVTFLAAVAGDNLGYLVGRRAGRPAVLRWGRRIGLTESRFARAEELITRRGRNVVVIARFIDGLRQTNGIIAGTVAMSWPQYAVRDAAGGVVWTAVWVTVGAEVGGNIERVHAVVGRYRVAAIVVAAVLVLVLLLWYLLRRRARRR